MKKKLLLSLVIALLVLSALCLVSCGDSPRANFYFLIVPFAWLIRQFSSWFGGNYILVLFFFALVIKIVFLPLSIHQQKNQIKGAKLRPQMALIERKYQGLTDQDSQMKKRNELMEMQQRANYSPMSGCLPMILQMVIVIVLYGVIRAPMTYLAQMDNNMVAEVYNVAYDISTSEEYGIGDANKYASKNIEKIEIPEEGELPWSAVQGIDQFKLVEAARAYPEAFAAIEGFSAVKDKVPSLMIGKDKINLADTPSLNCSSGVSMWLLLIPLLNFGLAVVTMRLTKKFSGNLQAELAGQTQDQRASTAIMDWMMPLMNLAFTFMFQAVLGVYWIFQSVLALVQMIILNKVMPMPTFTEEEIQAYKKSLNERPAANRDPNRPRPRSLHHIDDDDDDIPAPAPRIEANKRNPNTSKKKAKNYDERQRQAAREEARVNREQRKEEEKAAAEEKRLSANEEQADDPLDTTPAQATDAHADEVTGADNTTPAENESTADDEPTEKADS